MEQEDRTLIADFILLVAGVLIGYMVSITFESTIYKIALTLISIVVVFILYSGFIGRPWPRSYNKTIVCAGTDEEITRFFWTFYDDFEKLLGFNLIRILELKLEKTASAYLTLGKNNLKIESENKDFLDKTSYLVKEVLDSKNVMNLEMGGIHFQNALIRRPLKNVLFKTSKTKLIFVTRIKLKESDFAGIYSAAENMNLTTESEKDYTYFYWPDEKDFLYMKAPNEIIHNIKNIRNFINIETNNNLPYMRKHKMILDESKKELLYSVFIEAKWEVLYHKTKELFQESIDKFDNFLDMWGSIDNKAAVKYRFRNKEFTGLRIQDGIDIHHFAKAITLISEKDLKV